MQAKATEKEELVARIVCEISTAELEHTKLDEQAKLPPAMSPDEAARKLQDATALLQLGAEQLQTQEGAAENVAIQGLREKLADMASQISQACAALRANVPAAVSQTEGKDASKPLETSRGPAAMDEDVDEEVARGIRRTLEAVQKGGTDITDKFKESVVSEFKRQRL